MSINKWMVKWIMVHQYHKMLYSNKKKQDIDTYNKLHGSEGNIADGKMPISKSSIICDFIFIPFLQWQNYRDGKWFSDCLQ